MNQIHCIIKGCSTIFETNELVAANARFICKNHDRAAQVRAVGRKYNSETDEADKDIHFQDAQFDPYLGGGEL